MRHFARIALLLAIFAPLAGCEKTIEEARTPVRPPLVAQR
jgi:hypothetical protein